MASKTTRKAKAVKVPAEAKKVAHGARMSYEAASVRRRLGHWRPGSEGPNRLVAMDGRKLRDRARELVRNNPYAASACESFVANLVGTGIKPSPTISDKALRKAVSQAWSDWTDEADADGLSDFYGLQSLAGRAMFEAGECFIRLRARRPEDGLSVPLQLQLLEGDMCPIELNKVADNGNRIVNGVEFNAIGARVAYWFYRRHPGDGLVFDGSDTNSPVRVPADQVLHIFRPLRPGQVRGLPWVAPAMLKLWLLDSYDDAELERKKVAALFAGFIKAPEAVFEDEAPEADDLQDVPQVTLEPGTLQQLLPGEEIEFASPADVGGSYEAFQYRNLLSIASALSIPYAAMTGDLKKANYSSSRGGIVEFHRRLEQVQHGVMVYQMCRPVRAQWFKAGVLSGALPVTATQYRTAPLDYVRTRWIAPASQWADPYKDTNAELIAVRAGFKPLSDVLEANGYDAVEALERIADDAALLDDYGLVLDSDARKVSKAGLTQARAPGSVLPDPLLEGSDVVQTPERDDEEDDPAATAA
jgi:lambda family phage portal protein